MAVNGKHLSDSDRGRVRLAPASRWSASRRRRHAQALVDDGPEVLAPGQFRTLLDVAARG